MKWKRYKFITYSWQDYRPIVFNPHYPWWKVDVGFNTKGTYIVIVAYLPLDEPLNKYWDDAEDIEVEERDEITFNDLYPKSNFHIDTPPDKKYLDEYTTLIFDDELKTDKRFDKYDEESELVILKKGVDDTYVLMDKNYDEIIVKKKNIKYFAK